MSNHRVQERAALQEALRAEGAGGNLLQCVRFGVAFHHAGLAADERSLLEHAFRYLAIDDYLPEPKASRHGLRKD